MKFAKLSLVVSGLLLAGLAQAQDEVKAKADAAILKSCAPCHDQSMTPSFVDDTGALIDANIEAYAAKIVARVNNATRPMPPKSAPAFMQLKPDEKDDLLAYMAVLTGTKPTTPTTPSTPAVDSDAIVPLSKLTVEPGFKIEVFAQAKGARSLAVHPSGIVFVGTGGFSDVDPNGRVHAIVPTQSGNKVVALASRMNNPNGVALHGNDLYVAELSRIIVFKNAVATAKALAAGTVVRPQAQIVKDDLRIQSNHSWKYLAISPDNKLYVGIGADCNVCAEDRDVGAAIFKMDLDGSNYTQVAKGVRNTVGMTFHPVTGELWFTDNGRDSLGDNFPGDELNRLTREGQDFGFPFCFASNVTDPKFGQNVDCDSAAFTKPIRDLGPHVASLGLTHYTGSTFPAQYKNATFIAEHGSWNSSKKVGYRLSIVEETVSASGEVSYSYRPFVSGFVDAAGKTNWGRPVDVKNYIDGSLLMSGDNEGIVYRISPK